MTWAILWFICLFLRKPHPKFHTYFWRPSSPWRPDQVELKHTSRAALCYLNSWCVGSHKHRENFQFHYHRTRIFLTLIILFFSKISLTFWQKLCNTRFIKEYKPSNHIRARIKSHVYTTEWTVYHSTYHVKRYSKANTNVIYYINDKSVWYSGSEVQIR